MSWDVRLWRDVESWVLLVAGDKSGRWKQWYDEHIPIADDRFDEWLESEVD